VKEIAGNMCSPDGKTFACHKTTADVNGQLAEVSSSRHCAGALIYSENHKNATQIMRIAERLGMYDARKLKAEKEIVDRVFDSMKELQKANRENRP
jgi:hypothetical protein